MGDNRKTAEFTRRLDSPPIDPFHTLLLPAIEELIELDEIAELVSSESAVLVDGRVAVITQTKGGRDPGGYPV